jgi:HK97 family phage prohead protease
MMANHTTMTKMNQKRLDADVMDSDDDRIVAKLTTVSVDRDGEVLIPQGMNSKEYEKNPVLFYNHDYANPIGTVKRLKRTQDAVVGELKFAKRPDNYQGDFFPQFVETLVKQGVIKGVSVGFVAENGGQRIASKADRSRFGSGIKRVFNKWKLLEVSIAPLPANQDALIEAVGKGIVSPMQVKAFCGFDVPQPKIALPTATVNVRRVHKMTLHNNESSLKKAVTLAVRKRMGQLYE